MPVIEHASNPAQYGPAGGLQHFARMLSLLGVFVGPVAAVLIGAEAGAGDLAAGVFRDNVLTGRSRLALFLSPDPGGAGGDLCGHRARLRVRPGGHVRLRRRAADAEHVGDPGVGGVAGAGQRPGVRDRDRGRLAHGFTAGDDHRADRLGARAEPAARAVRSRSARCVAACWTGCCCSSSPGRSAARRRSRCRWRWRSSSSTAWLLILPGARRLADADPGRLRFRVTLTRMSQVSTAVAAVRDAIRRHPWWTDSLLALLLTFVSTASTLVAARSAGATVAPSRGDPGSVHDRADRAPALPPARECWG